MVTTVGIEHPLHDDPASLVLKIAEYEGSIPFTRSNSEVFVVVGLFGIFISSGNAICGSSYNPRTNKRILSLGRNTRARCRAISCKHLEI
jgi:hypothetical protein